jgi:hypothetical protein
LTVGLVASTTKLRAAGVGSALPAASVALTSKVWGPSARSGYSCGEVQLLKTVSSRLHSKVESSSEEENSKVAVRALIVPVGPESTVVSGAVESSVNAPTYSSVTYRIPLGALLNVPGVWALALSTCSTSMGAEFMLAER